MLNSKMKKSMAWLMAAAVIMTSVPVSAEEFTSDFTDTEVTAEAATDDVAEAGDAFAQEDESGFDAGETASEDGGFISSDSGETEALGSLAEENVETAVYDAELPSKDYMEMEQTYGLCNISAIAATADDFPEGSVSYSAENTENATDVYKEVDQALAKKYEAGYTFRTGKYEIVNEDGAKISFPSDTVFRITDFVDSAWDGIKAFRYSDGNLTEIKDADIEDVGFIKMLTFESDTTDGIFVYAMGLNEKVGEEHTNVYSDPESYDITMIEVTGTSTENFPDGSLSCVREGETAKGEHYDEIDEALASKYENGYQFMTNEFNIVDTTGNTITFPKDAVYTVTDFVPSEWEKIQAFKYENGKFTEVENPEIVDVGFLKTVTFKTTAIDGIYVFTDGLTAKDDSGDKDPEGEYGPAYGKIEAGTYTVSANVYIKGENNTVLPGVTAYMTNPDLPPITAAEDNAEMVVDEKGNITVNVKLVNLIFTLQEISDGKDVHIIEDRTVYGQDEGSTEQDWLDTTNGNCKGRYLNLAVTLDNMNGEYAFSKCKEYPIILNTFKTMPIHLSVDFASASRDFTPKEDDTIYSKDYTDENSGLTVSVKTTEAALGLKMQTAQLNVNKVTEDQEKEIKDNLLDNYDGIPQMDIWNCSLTDSDGQTLDLSGNTEVKATLKKAYKEMAVYRIDEGNRGTLAKCTSDEENIVFDKFKVGTYAIINSEGTKTYISNRAVNSATGAAVTEYATAKWVNILSGIRFNVKKTNIAGLGNKWEITGDRTVYISKFKYEIPVENENNALWLVVESKTGEVRVKKLDTNYKNGMAYFTLYGPEQDENGWPNKNVRDYDTAIEPLGNSFESDYDERAFYDGKGYIIETDKNLVGYELEYKYNKMSPDEVLGLTYNGQMQTGVLPYDLYTIEGNTAKNAGLYTAILTLTDEALNSGYVWYDGTTVPRNVEWNIKKAKLYLSSPSYKQTVKIGENPDLSYSIEGWQGTDSAENTTVTPEFEIWKNDFSASRGGVVIDPEKDGYIPGVTYYYTKVGNEGAENYEICNESRNSYSTKALVQFKIEGVPDPSTQNFEYDGKAHELTSNEYYTLSGDYQATKAGTYIATATLKNAEARWADGTQKPKTIIWTIARTSQGDKTCRSKLCLQ